MENYQAKLPALLFQEESCVLSVRDLQGPLGRRSEGLIKNFKPRNEASRVSGHSLLLYSQEARLN